MEAECEKNYPNRGCEVTIDVTPAFLQIAEITDITDSLTDTSADQSLLDISAGRFLTGTSAARARGKKGKKGEEDNKRMRERRIVGAEL